MSSTLGKSSANKLTAPNALKPGTWHHVMVAFDGSKPAKKAMTLYVDGAEVKATLAPGSVGNEITTTVPLTLGSRSGGDSKPTAQVALQDFRFYRRLLGAAEISSIAKNAALRQLIAISPDQRTKAQKETLYPYFLSNIDEPSRSLDKKLDELKGEQSAIKTRGVVSLVMQEKPEEPFAHILTRGVYSDKSERVTAETPVRASAHAR